MRKKLALITMIAALAVAGAAAQSASAAYIFVTVKYQATNLCRPTPDTLRYKLKFSAKISRSGVAKPRKIRVGYQVLDADSLAVLRSGVTNLKRSKGFKAKTSSITAKAGENLSYHLNMKYTVNGKSAKSKTTGSDFVPSVEQMDAAGVPSCG